MVDGEAWMDFLLLGTDSNYINEVKESKKQRRCPEAPSGIERVEGANQLDRATNRLAGNNLPRKDLGIGQRISRLE